jgi:ferric-dicitrate binding protein FerR (iron transport regulator)
MSETRKTTSSAPGAPSGSDRSTEGDAIARLLRLAGPRPAVPEAVERRVREATHTSWTQGLRATRRRRWIWGAAAAVAAGLAFALIATPQRPSAPPETAAAVQVATLQTATGAVTLIERSAAARPLRAGEPLFSGARVETGEGTRAALRLEDGSSLRLDVGTRLLLVARRSLKLERGGIYFASAEAEGSGTEPVEPLEVRTDLGVVRDIGTQFEVRRAGELSVRVRQGLVNLASDGVTYEAGAGVELRVSESGELSRHASANFGPSWDWILDVAAPFTLEGHTLEAFLAWVSRETGWTTEFADYEEGLAAASVVLHGSIEGLRPDRALEAVLPTCDLEHRFEDGVLLIEAETR